MKWNSEIIKQRFVSDGKKIANNIFVMNTLFSNTPILISWYMGNKQKPITVGTVFYVEKLLLEISVRTPEVNWTESIVNVYISSYFHHIDQKGVQNFENVRTYNSIFFGCKFEINHSLQFGSQVRIKYIFIFLRSENIENVKFEYRRTQKKRMKCKMWPRLL